MKSIIAIIVLVLAITSCGIFNKKSGEHKTEKDKKEKEDTKDAKETSIGEVLRFGQPVLVDSSEYVMYPLLYTKADDENFIERKIYDNPAGFVNIIFYNTKNGQYHLLDGSRKMLIHNYTQSSSYNYEDRSSGIKEGIIQSRKNIFYTITTLDLDEDDKIDNSDPKYLFISDIDGKNFKQLSPDNYNVLSWQLAFEKNIVLILTIRDTNGNKKFDKEDETIPFTYDTQTGEGPKEIFSDEFIRLTAKTLKEQWKEKEQ